MFKIDLHTHSVSSPDGGLTSKDYEQMLQSGGLDFIAITDHDKTDFAKGLQAKLGDKIIVGEEIYAREGELIGLYLQRTIPSGLSVRDTAKRIRDQGGLVYVPHPFEGFREGLQETDLDTIADMIDIVEVHNGRALLHYKHKQAFMWAARHLKAVASSSDAHGWKGWGRTFSVVDPAPTRENLVELLSHATHVQQFIGLHGILYPKLNRRRKKRAK